MVIVIPCLKELLLKERIRSLWGNFFPLSEVPFWKKDVIVDNNCLSSLPLMCVTFQRSCYVIAWTQRTRVDSTVCTEYGIYFIK